MSCIAASTRPVPLADRYREVRARTRALAEPLTPEDCVAQSMTDASPVKWHLGHTTWFFETFILAANDPSWRAFHPDFKVLFNSYYNAVGAKHPRPERGLLTRPSLGEVLAYREHVDHAMERLLGKASLGAEWRELALLGTHHEQQHQELILTDVKHLLSCNPMKPAYEKSWPLTPVHRREARWIAFEEGVRVSGCTAHFVTEQLDEGPVILQDVFHIRVGEDTLEEVKRRGKELESQVLSQAVQLFLNDQLVVKDKKVIFRPGHVRAG